MDEHWIALGFLVVAAAAAYFLIRTLNRIGRTVGHLEEVVKSLEKEIPPLLRNLKETSDHLNGIAAQARDRLNQLETLFQTVREASQVFTMINRILRSGITPTLVNLAGLAVGLKTAGMTLFKGKKEGGK